MNKRWLAHKNSLTKEVHHNIYLQRSYLKHGENSFEYLIVEELPTDATKKYIFEREEFYINTLKPQYNIGGVGGGDNFSNHPNKEAIREVHRRNLRKLRDEGKIPPVGCGEDNPNWKGAVHTTCSCGNAKSHGKLKCKDCHSKEGANNPFWGRTHTEETKQRLRESREGIPNLRDSKKVLADFKEYRSLTYAAECLGVSVGTIRYRLRKGWEGYSYL